MRILVVTAHDAVNLSIENVVKEFLNRGHKVGIYAKRMEHRHIRMFENLNLSIKPVSALNQNEIKKYDCAFCPMDGVDNLTFYDIYIFSYNFIFNNRWATAGGDFMFVQTENRPIIQWEDCARMAVGSPKNDTPVNEAVSDNTILFIDTGHYPFGLEGKTQLANSLLKICKKVPNYKIIVKPRWLPDENNTIHTSKIHLYNIILEICEGDIPDNLELLYEHRDMQELIDKSVTVITPGSSAYLDAALRGKRILILNGFTSDNSYDIRIDTVWKQQFKDMDDSGCVINFKEIEQYLPYGLKCREEHLNRAVTYRENVSSKIVDVVEYIYSQFLTRKKFPSITVYDFRDYKVSMKVDTSVNYTIIKQKRLKNQALGLSRKFDWVVADVDYRSWLTLLNYSYKTFPITPEGRSALNKQMMDCLYELWVTEKEKLMEDPIDQSMLFQALYIMGKEDVILEFPKEKIQCPGTYYYYLAKIYHNSKCSDTALKYYTVFLEEANSRTFLKYNQENDWGISDAYNCIFSSYNLNNLDASRFVDLTLALYQQRDMTIVSYVNRKRAHNLMPKVAKELADTNPEYALKCLLLYAKNEYHFNIRELNDNIKTLHQDIANIQGSKIYKIYQISNRLRNTIKHLRKQKLKDTIKRAREQINIFLKNNIIMRKIKNTGIWKIRKVFNEQIIAGYGMYVDLINEYGKDSFLHVLANSNGDVYLSLQYYMSYINKYFNDCNNIAVSSSSGYLGITNWYGISNAKTITNDQWKELIRLYIFVKNIHLDILHLHIFIRHTGLLAYLEGIHEFTFMSMQEEVLFEDLSSQKPPEDNYAEELQTMFERNGLVLGKTVILSPYTQSLKEVPMEYWVRLANYLKNMGMSVCTNAFGAQKPILNTIKIDLPFCKMTQFLNMAGYFVSCRSGIDDITYSAMCKRVEVFSEKKIQRSLVTDCIGCFAYSEDPIIVGNNNIDECVKLTIHQLGVDKGVNNEVSCIYYN